MLAPLQTTTFDPATLRWLNRHAALGPPFYGRIAFRSAYDVYADQPDFLKRQRDG